jgi:hypothetical protein
MVAWLWNLETTPLSRFPHVLTDVKIDEVRLVVRGATLANRDPGLALKRNLSPYVPF